MREEFVSTILWLELVLEYQEIDPAKIRVEAAIAKVDLGKVVSQKGKEVTVRKKIIFTARRPIKMPSFIHPLV